MNDVLRMINESGTPASGLRLTPANLAAIIRLVDDGGINISTGKSLLEKVQESGISPEEIVEREGLAQVSDVNSIHKVCSEVLMENPEQVENYRKGKTSLIGWFVGQTMRKSGGKADPQLVRKILESLLSS